MMIARLFLLVALLFSASLLSARVTWICGKGSPLDVPVVAETLGKILNTSVDVVSTDTTYLSVWANDPKHAQQRERLLAADYLFVTPSEEEPLELATLGLDAIASQRKEQFTPMLLVAAQKPVYTMRKLCDNRRLQRLARVSLGAEIDFLALPKVWQQVYTDDTFYNDKVPKGTVSESYVFAAGIALALTDGECDLPRLGGIHTAVADDLIESIEEGVELTEDVLYAARHLTLGSYDLRVGTSFSAVLYDGAFEHEIGEWLVKLAEADGRTLTLHYTTDTELNTGLPCLFRTVNPLGNAPKACTYTRPAYADDTGLTELDHLTEIIKTDADKQNWMPFPLAVAEWTRKYPNRPVYAGVKPTAPIAAMFAAMLYLEWTGVAVLPARSNQLETVAIGIGLDVMLRMRLQRAKVNAIFCRPMGNNTYSFSLWRKPTEKVRLQISTDHPDKKATPSVLEFTPETYWSRQTVTAEGPCMLLWKIPARNFPGQNTGIRVIE